MNADDVGYFHDALKAAGIPAVSVIYKSGVVSIDYEPVATPAQRSTGDAMLTTFDPAAARVSADRSKVIAKLINGDLNAKLVRALTLVIMDELNLHAVKINAILTAVDNAATLAALKTAVAAITDYPARTKTNLITALTNKINAGEADS